MGKVEEPIENTTFDKLKEKSLGCPSNILFWNDQQKHVSSKVEKMEHTLLMGDYGTGDIFYFKRLIIFVLKFTFQSQARPTFTNIICYVDQKIIIFHRQDPDPGGCSQDSVREG